MGKKISKAVKKITNSATGGLLADDKKEKTQAAAAVTEVAAPAASVVETPKDTAEADDETDTEGNKKNTRSQGKRALQVARSAGSGLNI